jgi:hypothetical protein
MRRTIRGWITAVGVGTAALAAVAGSAAGLAGAAGAPAAITVVHAARDCKPTECGGNHNQVLV